MNMIKVTLNDATYQYLQRELAEIQVREMEDQCWYVDEIKEARRKIKERLDYLKENVL